MNAPDSFKSTDLLKPDTALPDIQGTEDLRHLAIQRVGIRGVRHPLLVKTESGTAQPTVGTWSLDVHLPETKKGTHMSRFIALLEDHSEALDVPVFRQMLAEMVQKLNAESGRIEVTYPYFIRKAAPVSGVTSLLDYQITLVGQIDLANKEQPTKVMLTIQAPVTSLCPCSKEISEYGAHNQRSHVTIQVELKGELSVEELVRIAEDEASCELYGLLKRPDEKYVTERAYDNPKFVEDLVRDVVNRVSKDERVGHYVVEVENFESIHNHSAYARIERA